MFILVSFSSISSMFVKRLWFFHKWKPPINYEMEVPTIASYFRFDHHKVKSATCYRILGIEISIIRQGNEINEDVHFAYGTTTGRTRG